ncbi:MAG: asparaginase [Clostridia bacterium]|nr:asparaginase [Clostridia bacterium]
MKKILLIATGGTIVSRYGKDGLSPKITAEELLQYIEDFSSFCTIDTYQLFNLDSTNISPYHWLKMASLIEEKYDEYDGFVICHGTDTMAYTAAALSYLIQNNRKPVIVTGSQKPIDLAVTDAKTNLNDSIRIACDDRAYGTNIVFSGNLINGTRAKKDRTKSYNAFSSINYPTLATIQDDRIFFYLDDKDKLKDEVKFYHSMDPRVVLLKLIPGIDCNILKALQNRCDAVIIESFGVGGLPEYSGTEFNDIVKEYLDNGKIVVMATQVTHEGSDMSIYEVGSVIKSEYELPESYDMTLESTVAKTMWALSESSSLAEFKELFYRPVNHDLMYNAGGKQL